MFIYVLIGYLFFQFSSANDSFKENLVISNFNDAISFHFDFQTTTSDLISNNYNLFPKSISEIIKQYSVSEMHLALSKGFWNSEKWGPSPVSLPSESAELWAWFEPYEKEIDRKWDHLSHSLSGMFCTSLNKLTNKKEIIAPNWAYNPEGLTSKVRNNSLVRKSTVSGESICTENLTPWIKLLPCKKLAGLALLLKPPRLFASHFTSITMSVKKVCLTKDCDIIGRSIHQTITLVLDRTIFGNFDSTWSLDELLNSKVNIEVCSLAAVSRIYVHGFGPEMGLYISPSGFIKPNSFAYYDLHQFPKNNNKVNLKLGGVWPVGKKINDLSKTCPIRFTKFATGSGKVRGGIKATIRSIGDKKIRVAYLDSLPWYFNFLFSSLRVQVNSKTIDPQKIHYIPSLTRERMTHLELIIDIPAHSVVTIEYEFKKVLQNWNEFPPDANHEFYIGASSLTFQSPIAPNGFNNSLLDVLETTGIIESHSNRNSRTIRLHSEVVLVTMPSPDFSMPFNALCLACTVLAIMVGGVHKYTTCSVHVVDQKKDGIKGKLIIVILFIKSIFSKKIQDNYKVPIPEDKPKSEHNEE